MMGRQNRDKRQLFYEFIPVWERYPSPDGMFSRGDFAYDAGRDVYVCPNGKSLRTSGTVHDGRVRNYLSQPQDCRACTLKQRCTRAPFKKIARDINEGARNHARSLRGTPEFERSSNARKKVEMRFAHLKVQHGFERMRLRGLTGVPPRRHCAEPQDDGAAATSPANRWSVYVNCLRGSAGRFRCSPIKAATPDLEEAGIAPQWQSINFGEAFFDSIDPNQTEQPSLVFA